MASEWKELARAAKKAAVAGAAMRSAPELSRCFDALKRLDSSSANKSRVLANTPLVKRLQPVKNPCAKAASPQNHEIKIRRANGICPTKSEPAATKPVTLILKFGERVLGRTIINMPVKKSESKKAASKQKISDSAFQKPSTIASFQCKDHDATRTKVLEILVDALSKVAQEIDHKHTKDLAFACDPNKVAIAVESVMYKKLGHFNGANKLKYRSIMFNLRDAKNPDLRRRILLGEVKPEQLISMTSEKMASDQRQLENKEIRERSLNKKSKMAAQD